MSILNENILNINNIFNNIYRIETNNITLDYPSNKNITNNTLSFSFNHIDNDNNYNNYTKLNGIIYNIDNINVYISFGGLLCSINKSLIDNPYVNKDISLFIYNI